MAVAAVPLTTAAVVPAAASSWLLAAVAGAGVLAVLVVTLLMFLCPGSGSEESAPIPRNMNYDHAAELAERRQSRIATTAPTQFVGHAQTLVHSETQDIYFIHNPVINRMKRSNLAAATEETVYHGVTIPRNLKMTESVDFRKGFIFRVEPNATWFQGELCSNEIAETKLTVKVLNRDQKPSFLQEVAILWNFREKLNIVKILGYNATGLQVVMPRYPRGDLEEFALTQSPDTELTFQLLKDVAVALQDLHSSGIVHRDLRPGNVFIEEDKELPAGFRAVVGDFSKARILAAPGNSMTESEPVTAQLPPGVDLFFVAPEVMEHCRVAQGGPVTMTLEQEKAADVYRWACITYVLINRRLIF